MWMHTKPTEILSLNYNCVIRAISEDGYHYIEYKALLDNAYPIIIYTATDKIDLSNAFSRICADLTSKFINNMEQ